MHPQLTLLLEIQDLRGQLKEISSASSDLETEHFNIDPERAATQLEEKIGELEGRLEAPLRSRYDRIAPHRDRVVVPVINGVCYGCFVSIPTATAGEQETHRDVKTCQNCGLFIYIVS